MKKRSFLEKKSAKENKRFDAFNVINMMMFIALITLFVISLCFCVNNMTAGKTDKNYTIFLIMHILAIVIACLPFLAKKIFKIHIPYFATSMLYLFLFITSYLGTFMDLYQKISIWDSIVHFVSGLFLGFVALFFVNHNLKKSSQKPNAFFVFLFVVCFALACGALWEIYEFSCDSILGLNLQRHTDMITDIAKVGHEAVVDTMTDIIMDFLGGILSAVVCVVWSHFNNNFISYFKIMKIKQKTERISEIEE